MKQLKKTLLTLVALLAVTTGAWAQTETLLTTITPTDKDSYSETTPGVVTVTHDNDNCYYEYGWVWWDNPGSVTVVANEGYTITKCVFSQPVDKTVTVSSAPFKVNFIYNEEYEIYICEGTNPDFGKMDGVSSIEVYGYVTPAASSGPEVAWDGDKKTGTFTMPGGNVTLQPDYYPQATAAEGAVTAATDVKATTDAPLVTIDKTKLTGAKKLMYYVSTDATAPAYDAEGWTDVLPTAENYTEAATLYVWYYPVGTNEGDDDATATYSDGDICATALTVSLGAAPTYAVTFADDLTEPTLWTASPNTGVTKGQTVTVTYTGTKKVIGVKAEKKAAAAPRPLAEATAEDLGKIAGADGNIYDTKAAAEAANTTAVAMIAYVGNNTGDATYNHGLALALTDESSSMAWEDAKTACTSKNTSAPVSSASWMLPSSNQWSTMVATGGTYTTLRDGFTSVGGSNLQSADYWSSTEFEDDPVDYAWKFNFGDGSWKEGYKSDGYPMVRACLAF